MKAILKIFLSLATTAIIYNYVPAKQPPADLGYPPPAGWEFVMKLDSVINFDIYAYNDTCYLKYHDNRITIGGYKELFSFDGGETWKFDQELGINLKGVEFIINSTAMHRISYDKSDDNYYYEKSYDFFKSVHQRNIVEKKSPKYQPYAVIQSPIDSNILILIFKYASGL
ncbi:MAG: hypothetical protein HW421_3479, partial [Ignavibacteria bacterium]|nr:hypothetical protein [Ignavibacteria bacterium]